MKALAKKILALFSLKITVTNKKNKLLQMGLSDSNSKNLSDKKLYINNLKFSIDLTEEYFIVEGYQIILALINQCDAKFYKNLAEDIEVEINNIIYNIQTYEELFILNEIFINGVYNIHLKEEFHLIDIGMNVGFTSLYFAEQKNCISINAYEPFKPTYEQALHNLALNQKLNAKITPHNYGLGDVEKIISISYDSALKGNMGINGIPNYLAKDRQENEQEIIIKNSTETLMPILNTLKKGTEKIILKIDCEGSEYNIFKSFAKSAILKDFDIIIMEWHINGPEELTKQLDKFGFKYFSFYPKNKVAGMVYAFKNKSN